MRRYTPLRRRPGEADEPFAVKLERLTQKAKMQINSALQHLSAPDIGLLSIDDAAIQEDIHRLQDELSTNARSILEKSERAIQHAIDKGSIRRESLALENQFDSLVKKRVEWISSRSAEIESMLRSLQEKLSLTDSAYEEVLAKKSAAAYYTSLTDATLSKILKLIDRRDPGWTLIRSEDGVEVWRKFFKHESKFAMVRAMGVVNASPKDIFAVLGDNNRAREYNEFLDKAEDLEDVAENTRIVWSTSFPIFPFKPRDFCTLVHFRSLRDGTLVVLNTATEHPLAHRDPRYQRGYIVLGANIIQPIPGENKKCRLTMLTQVDPGGILPPMLINSICTMGPPSYFKQIEAAANKHPSIKYIKNKHKTQIQNNS